MEEAKKEHQDLFKSAIARLKTAGVDTTCYKDVVIALETENRHYLDLIEHLKEAGEAKREKAHKSGIERGKNLGQCAMAAKILEYFMECCSSSDDHLIHIGIEDLTGICIAAWMELQGMEPD